jgi:hypothetical protein
MDLIADIFNLAKRFNVAGVNVLWSDPGRPTSAYDPRQFQFSIKVACSTIPNPGDPRQRLFGG